MTATVSVGEAVTSPPTTWAPTWDASATIPSVNPSSQATSSSGGAHSATSKAVGVAPIATMSARLAAAARCPTSTGLDQSGRKCRPATKASVQATTRPSGAATTAASSPGPSSTDGPVVNRAVIRAINPNSPVPVTLMAHTPTPLACPVR